MLVNLHVKNLALIQEEDITFLDGLHILSGETGAGKSMILDALHLALGGKVAKEMLRDNSEEALVEVVFRVTREEQRKKLAELEIETYDDEVIVSRKITEARSVAKINGETVPAIKLKQVGDIFLDIHGQQEHQSLLHKKKHLELLDDFAKVDVLPLKKQIKESYARYITKQKEWEGSNLDESERLREISFLEHEIAEIEQAHLKPEEDEQLEQTFKKLSHGRKIMEALSISYQNTSGADGALESVSRGIRELSSVSHLDPSLEHFLMTLTDVEGLLSDFNRDLSSYMSDASFDESTFVEVERRLNDINRLKDKYGSSMEEIFQALEEKKERLEKLQSYGEYLLSLKEDLEKAREVLEQDCQRLSQVRQQYASKLCKQVELALGDLNFLEVAFDMDFARLEHFTADGFDDAEFVIRTNPGEPMGPLKDIASGGEMSRVMLAIKTVLAANDDMDTLIFDEIDTGISGRTAQAVSEKLSLVAKNHQVICITHLPQIAAMADHHYLIEKEVVGGGTISSIQALSYHDSIQELARMLGGVEITQAVLDNAKEMKDFADSKKTQLHD